VYVRFLVDKVALGEDFYQCFRFPLSLFSDQCLALVHSSLIYSVEPCQLNHTLGIKSSKGPNTASDGNLIIYRDEIVKSHLIRYDVFRSSNTW
jgi:hypothetical protein